MKAKRLSVRHSYTDGEIRQALESTADISVDEFREKDEYKSQREILDRLTLGDLEKASIGEYGELAKSSAWVRECDDRMKDVFDDLRRSLDGAMAKITMPISERVNGLLSSIDSAAIAGPEIRLQRDQLEALRSIEHILHRLSNEQATQGERLRRGEVSTRHRFRITLALLIVGLSVGAGSLSVAILQLF